MLDPAFCTSELQIIFFVNRDNLLNIFKYYHVSFTACECLRSYRQHVMSKGYGASKLLVLSWSIPGLSAINAKTGHNHLRGVYHLLLTTLCVGLHPISQENYHRAQLTGFDAIPDEEYINLNQSYSLQKAVFSCVKAVNMCMWDEIECWFCHFNSSLPKPTNLLQLSTDLM